MENVRRIRPDTTVFGANAPRFSWEGLVGLGALLVILGSIALFAPVMTTMGLSVMMGVLFLASGIAQLAHAFRYIREKGKFTRFLLAGLSLVAGVMVLRNPVVGAVAITTVTAIYLLVSAVGRGILAFEIKPETGWGSLLFSAVISFVLGAYLLASFPTLSLVVPGIFFGVDLVVFGISLVAFAMNVRRLGKRIDQLQDRRAA